MSGGYCKMGTVYGTIYDMFIVMAVKKHFVNSTYVCN